MPEHDTYDLDAAFRALEDDIAGLSSPRGASSAVATSRRRRRKTIGGVAAAVVLVGGIAVAGALGGDARDRSTGPADGLPAPAPLGGPQLTAATDGWTPAWTADTQKARQKLSVTFGGPCIPSIAGGTGAIVVLGNSHDDLAMAELSNYGGHRVREARSWRRVEQQVANCDGASQVSSFADASGAMGRTYRIDATSSKVPQYVWIVSTGREIGMLKILDQSDPLPTANDRPVADALLAAVQDPASYVQPSLSPSSSPSRSIPAGFVADADFAAAVGSWSSGWSQHSGNQAADGLPCSAPDSNPSFGQQTSLGANGDQELFGYDSPTEAESAVQLMVASLKACPDATYDVQQVGLPFDGAVVTVVAATGQYDDDVWLARQGRRVFAVIVPNGDTLPPRQVSQQVGGLMFDALHGVSETASGPASGSSP